MKDQRFEEAKTKYAALGIDADQINARSYKQGSDRHTDRSNSHWKY